MQFKIKYVFAAILAFFFLTAHAAETTSEKEIEKTLQQEIKKYHIPGISVSYLKGNNPIKTVVAGYTDLSSQNKVTDKTVFYIGSITKSFIAAKLMQLVQANKVALDDTLSHIESQYPQNSHLSQVVAKYPYLGQITLRQYLNHTSGIADSINNPIFIEKFNKAPTTIFTPFEMIDIAMTHKPYFAPGAKGLYGYTNSDYIIAALVIEAITNKSVKENMDELLSTINIANIYYPPIDHSLEKLSHGYISIDDNFHFSEAMKNQPLLTFDSKKLYDVSSIAKNYSQTTGASGGAAATTESLLKWYQALFSGHVISTEYLHQMLEGVHTADENKKYALAVVVQQDPEYGVVYSHDGNFLGYETNLLYIPKYKLYVAIADNMNTGLLSDVDKNITKKILQVILQ